MHRVSNIDQNIQDITDAIFSVAKQSIPNKRQKDCLWKQRTHCRSENGSLGFIETLHKQ